jgi:hypothetical protein
MKSRIHILLLPLSWSACALAVQMSTAKLPLAAFATLIGFWVRDAIYKGPRDYTLATWVVFGVGLAETLVLGWFMHRLRVPIWVYGFVGLFAVIDLMSDTPLLVAGTGVYVIGIVSVVASTALRFMRWLRRGAPKAEGKVGTDTEYEIHEA